MSTTPLAAGNARVKDARRLSRRSVRTERRLFLAEGPQAVEAALAVDGRVVEVFATPEAVRRFDALLGGAVGTTVTLVDDRALASLTEAVSPAGLVAVCRLLDRPLEHVVPGSRLVALCAEVRDPGNAGTIVRTTDAAGGDAVVLAGDAVDLHNPKTLRASAGSAFHVPVALEPDPVRAVEAARAAGLTVLAADGAGELDLAELEDAARDAARDGGRDGSGGALLARPTAWLLGNEAHGLDDALAALADHRVRIPIHGRAESLNLASAATLCLYASATAQRR
ncbi:TrmH family RNA methyltransferase [Nocardioides aquaticus]|uniref:TrmH family RNA methyltransferase n=1 Tax=Nocardioides aquaticus TaxID=160826 RepID=UPI001BD27D5A|nr:RNA methyltransferase [Nocardioides aquaticus]